MISNEFDDLWKFTNRHGQIQQDYTELKHIYELIKGCESYLEIGTAEGGSICVLGKGKKQIAYVDYDENHTRSQRMEALGSLGTPYQAFHGNSHDPEIISKITSKYDVVLIDAGHSYEDAKQDAENYGKLATKFIIFHDVQLPAVKRAFDEYTAKFKDVRTFINSTNFGYGIVTL